VFTIPILAFTMPIQAFTMDRSRCSRSADLGVHDGPMRAFYLLLACYAAYRHDLCLALMQVYLNFGSSGFSVGSRVV
jgi:hypothetical protein